MYLEPTFINHQLTKREVADMGFIVATIRKNEPDGDVLRVTEKVSKTGKPYPSYTLFVNANKGNGYTDFEIPNLFKKDLNPLIFAFGNETTAWVGKKIIVSVNFVVSDGIPRMEWVFKEYNSPVPVEVVTDN